MIGEPSMHIICPHIILGWPPKKSICMEIICELIKVQLGRKHTIIKEAACGRLHNGGRASFGRQPTVVESIMGDGEAAHVANI